MRIFFGATLPDATKREITEIQETLRPNIPTARFEGVDKLHITLQFIGDFSERELDRLFASAVEQLGHCTHKSPATDITGISYFPDERVRRGIWLDCRDDGSLATFANALKTASWEFGIVPESRAFKPHITIARLREAVDKQRRTYGVYGRPGRAESRSTADLQKLVGESKLSVERFFPTSVALFESTLKPSGSQYRILQEYSLE